MIYDSRLQPLHRVLPNDLCPLLCRLRLRPGHPAQFPKRNAALAGLGTSGASPASSPAAIRIAFTAAPIAADGRSRPWGPFGTLDSVTA